SRVMTDNGLSGYVPNDDIKPVPPTPRPKMAGTPAPGGFWSRRRAAPASNFSGGPQPLFDVNEVPPPPLPGNPEKPAGPAPAFRYSGKSATPAPAFRYSDKPAT